ncbi:unnamed protein product [Leuciscus chuanchicus]
MSLQPNLERPVCLGKTTSRHGQDNIISLHTQMTTEVIVDNHHINSTMMEQILFTNPNEEKSNLERKKDNEQEDRQEDDGNVQEYREEEDNGNEESKEYGGSVNEEEEEDDGNGQEDREGNNGSVNEEEEEENGSVNEEEEENNGSVNEEGEEDDGSVNAEEDEDDGNEQEDREEINGSVNEESEEEDGIEQEDREVEDESEPEHLEEDGGSEQESREEEDVSGQEQRAGEERNQGNEDSNQRKLKELEQVGIKWRDSENVEHTAKVHCLLCSSDSVARPLLRNTKQFNGKYGCDFCLHHGGGPYIWETPEPPLRTEKDHFRHAMLATPAKPVMGVKGPSPLMELESFHMINGFVPEYQHSVCLGVTKQITSLWLDSKHHKEDWYLGSKTMIMRSAPPCVCEAIWIYKENYIALQSFPRMHDTSGQPRRSEAEAVG